VAGELALALAGTNERFDREIFLTACGVKWRLSRSPIP
jgi:hypothetical protein